jgi:Spy/CpxP family protein refolding chaperone
MKEKSMKTRIAIVFGLFVAVVLLSVPVFAQQPQPPQPAEGPQQPRPQTPPTPPHPPMDPLGEAMFPPDMIMQHTRELGLTDEQKTFMRSEIQRTTTRFNELQWQLQDAMEALHETMKSNSVNEQQALAQLDKVLDAEREIKRLHVGMAIRIKNQLTPEQQQKLHSMRHPMGRGPGGPGRGPDGPGGPGPEPGPAPRPEGQPKPNDEPMP